MESKKIALIAGSNEKSIGRLIAEKLQNEGYSIWIYGRNAKKKDNNNWHERACDLTDNICLDRLFIEIKDIPDIIIFSADSGTGHGNLEDLQNEDVNKFIGSKIIGSLNLVKKVITNKPKKKIVAIWLAGKSSNKPKNLILFSLINSALNSLVAELNIYYKNIIRAYYLETPLISPSTLGDEYILKYGINLGLARKPEIISEKVIKIINEKTQPGIISLTGSNEIKG